MTTLAAAPPLQIQAGAEIAPDHVIADRAAAAAIAESIRTYGVMGLDTEFITERSFRPLLALVQVSTPDGAWIIDPLADGAPDQPIWECMADPGITTVVHAHEQETRFCIARTGRPPAGLFDVQLAAGFAGHRFPIAYAALVGSALGRKAAASQSRSEWTRRPLSPAQLEYAADDVHWLLPLHRRLSRELNAGGRLGWAAEELEARVEHVRSSQSGDPEDAEAKWRRMSGAGKLGPRQLAALRELHAWRRSGAARADVPVKRIARDEILVAAAAALPRSLDDLLRIRGIAELPRRSREPILDAVARARALPEGALPEPQRRDGAAAGKALRRFLEAVLESACARHGIDSRLVGTAADLNALIAHRLSPGGAGRAPRLLAGWRGEVCGRELCEAIEGRVALRIDDPRAEQPLSAGPVPGK